MKKFVILALMAFIVLPAVLCAPVEDNALVDDSEVSAGNDLTRNVRQTQTIRFNRIRVRFPSLRIVRTRRVNTGGRRIRIRLGGTRVNSARPVRVVLTRVG